MKHFLIFVSIIIVLVVNSHAKELSNYTFGIYTNLSLNSHNADFRSIPDCPSCSPGYRDGNGFGGAFGLLAEYKYNNKIRFGLRGSYYSISGLLKARENITLLVQGVRTAGAIEHSIDASIASIGIEPNFSYSITDKLFISAGFHIGSITKKNYQQKEEIVSPKGTGTFLDADGNDTFSRLRNVFSGEIINSTQITISPFLGVSYQLNLNSEGSIILEPEIFYFLGLSNLVNDDMVDKWKVNSLRSGIALKYTPQAKTKIQEQFERIKLIDTISIQTEGIEIAEIRQGTSFSHQQTQTIDNVKLTTETIKRTDTLLVPKQYNISADITIVSLTEDGSEEENKSLIVEDYSFNRLDPLLNYIFFDEMSYSLPHRYNLITLAEAVQFHLDSLYQSSTMELYYNMINIIGKRLQLYPNSKITLIGTNSDTDEEKNNNSLSRNRAETVKNYLTSIWQIHSNRITIQSRNLPEKPSTPITDNEKKSENRRVEIVSDDYRIIEPLFIQNIERRTDPKSIRFKISASADNKISSWEIGLNQLTNTQGMTISGIGNPPSFYDVNFENDTELIPYLTEPLIYRIKIIDEKGLAFQSQEKKLPVQIVTIDEQIASDVEYYEVEKFSLILFDFDKSDITGNNLKIMEFIKGRIKPGSLVEIKGYTDRTGEETYNRRLSRQRADAALRALGVRNATSIGLGKSELLYDNDLPEGRFYCRTVDVFVKTPIK